MTAALEGGKWSAARPGCTFPPGKTRYPFYRRLGGPQGRSGRAENLFPTGIRSRTVQSVVSRYTYWATRPTLLYISRDNLCTPGLIFCSNVFEIFLYNDYLRHKLGSWYISRHRIKYWGYLSWMEENHEATLGTQPWWFCLWVSFKITQSFLFCTIARMSCKHSSLVFAAPFCPIDNLPINSAVINTNFMKLDQWKFC